MRAVLQRIFNRTRRVLLARRILRPNRHEDPLKWGIIGTGYMATIWADLLLATNESQLYAVCSRSEQKARDFGRKFGCNRYFGDLEHMLNAQAEQLDLVYVATPLASHYPIIEKCIDAGVNVLTEKPATKTAPQWEDLCRRAKARGVLLIEGMWTNCLPTMRQAETWINEGRIGNVQWIRVELNKFNVPSLEKPQEDKGVLMDYGVYALGFASRFLGGQPETVKSHVRRTAHGDDADWSIIAHKQDRTAIINLSSNFHAGSGALVVGESGMIEWSSPFNRTNEIILTNFQSSNPVRMHYPYRHMGFEFQLEEVTRTFRNGHLESVLLNHRMTTDTLRFSDQLLER